MLLQNTLSNSESMQGSVQSHRNSFC